MEKELCLNNTISTVAEKQEVIVQVENLQQYQRVILGVLLAIAGLSMCINFCICLYCLRRRQTKRVVKTAKNTTPLPTHADQKDAIYVL